MPPSHPLHARIIASKAALCLARDTKDEKWRQLGEESVKSLARFAEYSSWNYENMLCLLQAELHYLNCRHRMAQLSYQGAIVSAHDHRFYHEEALARELYGFYLVENGNVKKGVGQLKVAKDLYMSWGATRKVEDVNLTIDMLNKSRQWTVRDSRSSTAV